MDRAVAALAAADALVITAGAGMGVDSGLPDFRGREGFWNAYPPYAELGLDFFELANPRWFKHDPALAWGFYGHRLNMYRTVKPHEGFQILKKWAEAADSGRKSGWFVVTSNVDGHFQRAGFDPERIVEVHGAIDWLQCTAGCGIAPFPADPYVVTVDETTMRAAEPFPTCPNCRRLARPNILMFGDYDWVDDRSDIQNARLADWLSTVRPDAKLVVVELGAGTAVPTIRRASETLAQRYKGTLLRINVRESEVPAIAPPGQAVSFPYGALEALRSMDTRLGRRRGV
ncbi:MAG: Sir2 family NAD-dependent protein deacetylase [Isosphaeraceae bacterium]